ncbi:hypothetical protein [Candidatus Avelusimicrobium aviculae]|uniref:hypothetical protein n=1 Tax=Candidatus Avelusimicrobium aviculae TaxID=3416206 RepID=UPI003D0A25DD
MIRIFTPCFLCTVLFFTCPQPLYAGGGWPKKIKTATQTLSQTSAKTRTKIAAAVNTLNKRLSRKAAEAQPWQHSVFYIKPSWKMPVAGSGFVFQTNDQAEQKIFGFISAHITPVSLAKGEKFDVVFLNGKKPLTVRAELLLRGTSFRLDAALIRFEPTAEFLEFVKPFSLNERKVVPWATLSAVGYARQEPSLSPNRKVKILNPSLITTSYTLERHKRAGFCGSPLLNAQGEVVGLHCGSLTEDFPPHRPSLLPKGQNLWPVNNYSQRVSFAVPARLLGDLVRAYHQGGSFKRPILWDSLTVAEIDVNEHIENITVFYSNSDNLLQSEPLWLADKEPFLNELNLRETFDHPNIQGIMIMVQSAPRADKTCLRRTYVTDLNSGITDVSEETVCN